MLKSNIQKTNFYLNLLKALCSLVFLFTPLESLFGQEQKAINIDSLRELDIKILYDRFDKSVHSNPKIAKVYGDVILLKMKESKSVTKIATGYNIVSRLYADNLDIRIAYIDSAISFGVKSKYKYYPTRFYLGKGAILADKGHFIRALDSYLTGLKYAKKKKNPDHEYALYHNIALLKRKLGKYQEAKSLFKKSLDFESLKTKKSKNDSLSYLVTLADLVTTYIRANEIDSAFVYNNKGIKISKNPSIKNLFRLNEGIINYYNKDYTNSISDISQVLNSLSKGNNRFFSNYNIMDANYFLGKSYEATDKKEKAILNYKRIDSLVLETNYLIPEIRPAYDAIIKHYQSLGDKTNQLHYINRLLYNDSILDHNFKDLNDKIIKGFDTPILLSEKEKLIDELKTENSRSNYWLVFAIIVISVITVFLIYNYKKHKRYKSSFEELMDVTQEKLVPVELPIITKASIGIADDVVENILLGIQNFEQNNGFTSTGITSTILAKQLNTNTKYLTKVIKHHKQKNFSPYINDLRVNHIIDRLKNELKLRQYTIKALAEEAGFNSHEVFSKYFYKKTGIYPSYFIKQLKTSENQFFK